MAFRFNKRRRDENKSVELIALPVISVTKFIVLMFAEIRRMLSLANNSII